MSVKNLRIISLTLLLAGLIGYIWMYRQTEQAFIQKQLVLQTIHKNYLNNILEHLQQEIDDFTQMEKQLTDPATGSLKNDLLPSGLKGRPSRAIEGALILDDNLDVLYERGPRLFTDSLGFCLLTDASSEGVYTCPIYKNTVLYSYLKREINHKIYNIIFYRAVNDSLAREMEALTGIPVGFMGVNDPAPQREDYEIKELLLTDVNNQPLIKLASYFPTRESHHLQRLQIVVLLILVIQGLALWATDNLGETAGLAARLKQKNDKIQKISRQRETLVRVLSHDLKNYLTRILGQTELALMETDLSASLTKRLKKIRESVDRQTELISNVSRQVALESGKLQLDIREVKIEALLQEVRDIFAERLEQKKLSLEIDNGLNGHHLLVDPLSFNQNVLGNLISNAIKFSFPGESIQIRSRVESEKFVRIEIEDHGMGIPEELRRNIWDENKRTHRPGTSGEKGTGFGMPLAKKFTEAQGGSIHIESESIDENTKRHGTRVILKIPYN